MYFFIQTGCSKYILEIINFKQLVHAINIGWAHENKFKLHKNVSLIKFSKIKLVNKQKRSDQTSSSLFFPHAPRTPRVLINCYEHASKITTPRFQKIRGFCFTFWLSSKKIKICICFKEVYSIKQIVTVLALQTGQPASAGDPTYHVNVFIQQPITRSEQLLN